MALRHLDSARRWIIVIFFRRWIPESPRWLMIHGRSPGGRDRCGRGNKKLWRTAIRRPEERRYSELFRRVFALATHTPWREMERDVHDIATFVSWFRAHVNAGIFL